MNISTPLHLPSRACPQVARRPAILKHLTLVMLILGVHVIAAPARTTATIISTTNVCAKVENVSWSGLAEREVIQIAMAFIADCGNRQFRYLRSSSFTKSQHQSGPARPGTLEHFVQDVNDLTAQRGCQLEVLAIEADAAVRWVCSDRSNGRRIIHGMDPFQIAGGDLLFTMVAGKGELPNNIFTAYVLRPAPELIACRRAVERLRTLDDTIDWRIYIVTQPWQFQDVIAASRNPNLLLFKPPLTPPEIASSVMSAFYFSTTKTIDTWVSNDFRSRTRGDR